MTYPYHWPNLNGHPDNWSDAKYNEPPELDYLEDLLQDVEYKLKVLLLDDEEIKEFEKHRDTLILKIKEIRQ